MYSFPVKSNFEEKLSKNSGTQILKKWILLSDKKSWLFDAQA